MSTFDDFLIDINVDHYSKEHGVDPELTRRVVKAESNFNPKATSPAGAQGLMQLMPATAKGLGVTDPYDITQNINGGTKYLSQQLKKYKDVNKALAAYNAGPGAVDKYGGVPPFKETQGYVKKITKGYTPQQQQQESPLDIIDQIDKEFGALEQTNPDHSSQQQESPLNMIDQIDKEFGALEQNDPDHYQTVIHNLAHPDEWKKEEQGLINAPLFPTEAVVFALTDSGGKKGPLDAYEHDWTKPEPGLIDPVVDPVMGFSSGAGAGGILGRGIKGMVKGAALGGTSALAGEAATAYPLAMIEESDKIPGWAKFPINVAIGIGGSLTVERMVEDELSEIAQKGTPMFVRLKDWVFRKLKRNKIDDPIIKKVNNRLKEFSKSVEEGAEVTEQMSLFKEKLESPSPKDLAKSLSPEKQKDLDDLIKKIKGIPKPKVGDEGGFVDVGGAGKNIKEFFHPMSTVPEADLLMQLRQKGKGSIAKVERITEHVKDKLKPFSKQEKELMFDAVDGTVDINTLPSKPQLVAKQLRNLNTRIGKMLVKRGMLSEETFKKHKNNYIRYSYLRYLFGNDVDSFVRIGGSRQDLSYLIPRKDMTDEQREAIGWIKDLSVAEPISVALPLRDMALHDYYQKLLGDPVKVTGSLSSKPGGQVINQTELKKRIAKVESHLRRTKKDDPEAMDNLRKLYELQERSRSKWVFEPSVTEFEGKRVGIGWLKNERDAMEKVVSMDKTNVPAQNRLEDLRDAIVELESRNISPSKNFHTMPNDKHWGPLAGASIRKEIADDIIPLVPSSKGDSGIKHFISFFEKGMTTHKIAKVAFNPPTISRNVTSGYGQINMSGMPLRKIPKTWAEAAYEMYKKESIDYQQAFREGLFQTNWNNAELREVLDDFKADIGTPYMKQLHKLSKLSKYYGKIDDIHKFTLFKWRKSEGDTIAQAAKFANKWGMDYSLAPRSVKGLRRAIIPFMTYRYKITALTAESLAKRPWVIGKWYAVKGAALAYSLHKLGLTWEEYQEEKKNLPKYIKQDDLQKLLPDGVKKSFLKYALDSPNIMPLSKRSPEGHLQFVNIGYQLPWGNIVDVATHLSSGNFSGDMLKDVGIGNPFINIFAGFQSASKEKMEPITDPYSGYPIYNAVTDDTTTKALKTVMWIGWQFAPTGFNPDYGALGKTKKAVIGKLHKHYGYEGNFKDKYGRTITPEVAALAWVGVNVIAPTKEQGIKGKKYNINKAKMWFRKFLRDNPGATDLERDEALKRYQEAIKEIMEN